MSRRPAGRVLMITPLDYDKLWNNFEHNRVHYYSRAGYEVALIYKAMNRAPGLWRMVRDSCSLRIHSRSQDGATLVSVDPFFNYFAGLRSDSEAQAEFDQPRISPRRILIRLLSPLSFLRDLFTPPCLVLAALVKLRGRWDVCIGFGPWGGMAGWALRRVGKVRRLVYQDRDYEAGLVPDRMRQSYTAAVERFTIRRADLVVSMGKLLAELRWRQTGRRPHIIPSGVDWSRYSEAREANRSGQTLIYVGNLISWCGLEHVIQAMPGIVRACPQARLQIVGDGLPGYRDRLERLVRQHALSERIEFLGQRPPSELPRLLAQARIGLSNSEPVAFRRYACPLKVMEYMAAGLPVIATEDTEAADLLKRFDSGLAVPWEAGAFAQAAIRLLTDQGLYRRLRDNAIRHSAEMDWERLLSRELALISTGQPSPPAALPGGGEAPTAVRSESPARRARIPL